MADRMFGPYRLESLLGRGGMGEVWRAVDTSQDDRVVAVKVLGGWLGADEAFQRRFRRESAQAAKLRGPHIVPIHRYGEIDGRLYIDMQLVEGVDLATLLQRQGALPPARALRIITQTAAALATAHHAGLMHRDVKPSNILVATDGDDDHAYLIDFGIARHVDSSTHISRTGNVLGTLAYMAPERFDGAGDHRSDIYALGCVLHEALTGQPPFPSADQLVVMKDHLATVPPRTSLLRQGVPRQLDDVVARALAKEPARRYRTVVEFADALRATSAAAASTGARPQAEATRPMPVRAPGTPPRLRPPPWQHPSLPVPPPPPAPRQRQPLLVAVVVLAVLAAVGLLIAAVVSGMVPGTSTGGGTTTAPTSASVAQPIREVQLTGHNGFVLAVTTAELDGRPTVVTGSYDNTARIWSLDVDASFIVTGHAGAIAAVATAQLDGRSVLVTGSYDNTARVWDMNTAAPVGQPMTGHTYAIYAIATAQLDGRTVVITGSGGDNTVRVWDLATQQQVGAPLAGHTGEVLTLTTAQLEGRTVVVTAGSDATIRVWDLATHPPVGQPLTGHIGTVYSVATAQLDGRQVLVSGGDDDTVRAWDLATHQPIGTPMTGHTSFVRAVTTAEVNGRTVIASGSDDTTARTWDLSARAST